MTRLVSIFLDLIKHIFSNKKILEQKIAHILIIAQSKWLDFIRMNEKERTQNKVGKSKRIFYFKNGLKLLWSQRF